MNEGGQEFQNSIRHTTGPAEPSGNWRGVSSCDYDLDGDLDIFLTGNGPRLLRNDRPAVRHWLRVGLRRDGANRFGVGARIRVIANGVMQTRQVFPTGSWSRGDPLPAHFGLDMAGVVDSLEVRWPGGHVERFTGVPVDRQMTLYENHGIVGVEAEARGPVTAVLKGCYPNHASRGTVVAFDLPSPERVKVRIYDLAGRLVRVLADGELRARGAQEIRWDGRDGNGQASAQGLYFVRLETPGTRGQRKVMLIR